MKNPVRQPVYSYRRWRERKDKEDERARRWAEAHHNDRSPIDFGGLAVLIAIAGYILYQYI